MDIWGKWGGRDPWPESGESPGILLLGSSRCIILGRGICGYVVYIDGIPMQVGAVVTYMSDAWDQRPTGSLAHSWGRRDRRDDEISSELQIIFNAGGSISSQNQRQLNFAHHTTPR